MKDEGEVDENAYTEYDVKFAETMGNDINTSSAITVLYDMLKEDFHRPPSGNWQPDLTRSFLLD